MTKPLFTVACAAAIAGLSCSPGAFAGDDCFAKARTDARALVKTLADRDAARLFLEKAIIKCNDPEASPERVAFMGAVNADGARLARDFFAGTLSLSAYSTALADRQRKVAASAKYLPDLSKGDADGDLVPDPTDRCPGTPYGTPTRDDGCTDRKAVRPEQPDREARLRRELGRGKILYNPKCEGAPRPLTPAPIAWGRGPQAGLNTHGFNFSVAKVPPGPSGCETFYEIDLRFSGPNAGNPALPPTKHVTLVFRDNEDQLNDSFRAIFPLPMPLEVPLSPHRTVARLAFSREYEVATWRVRAVNGSNVSSHWSPYITQGPASGGVP